MRSTRHIPPITTVSPTKPYCLPLAAPVPLPPAPQGTHAPLFLRQLLSTAVAQHHTVRHPTPRRAAEIPPRRYTRVAKARSCSESFPPDPRPSRYYDHTRHDRRALFLVWSATRTEHVVIVRRPEHAPFMRRFFASPAPDPTRRSESSGLKCSSVPPFKQEPFRCWSLTFSLRCHSTR